MNNIVDTVLTKYSNNVPEEIQNQYDCCVKIKELQLNDNVNFDHLIYNEEVKNIDEEIEYHESKISLEEIDENTKEHIIKFICLWYHNKNYNKYHVFKFYTNKLILYNEITVETIINMKTKFIDNETLYNILSCLNIDQLELCGI